MKKELLAPAGNPKALERAVMCGADAVYIGLKQFNARTKAENFSFEELENAVRFTKLYGVKLYVTLNINIKENEIKEAAELIEKLSNYPIDGVIATDLAVISMLSSTNIPIHISTQAGVINRYAASFFKGINAYRLVLAREVSFNDIKSIKEATGLSLEYFVQGALCCSFSGACTLSKSMGHGSGNRGDCTQPCRLLYELSYKNQKSKGYFLSTADLCLIDRLKELETLGIDSFKIEGRLRRNEYVAEAVLSYKKAFDNTTDTKQLRHNLMKVFNRGGFSEGYIFSDNKAIMSTNIQNHMGVKCGKVLSFIQKGGYPYGRVHSGYSFFKGDGIKIVRDKKEIGGTEIHSVESLKNNEYLLPLCKNAKVGDIVHLTTDAQRNTFLNRITKKLPLDIRLYIKEKLPVKMVAYYGSLKVEKESEYIPSILENKEFRQPNYEEQLTKLGETEFFANQIRIEADKDLFVPLSIIKGLRQEIVVLIREEIIKKRPTKRVENSAIVLDKDKVFRYFEFEIYRPLDYRLEVIKEDICKKEGRPLYIYLPKLFGVKDERALEKIAEFIKGKGIGVYADSFGAVEFCRENSIKYGVGAELNIMNVTAASYFSDADFVYASTELNEEELSPLLKIGVLNPKKLELPLMVLKVCPLKLITQKGCSNCQYTNDSPVILKDTQNRERVFKRVITESGCYFLLADA